MGSKPVKSVIEKVVLQGDVLEGESFEPTLINFFFGKNGSGKSTVAKQTGAAAIPYFNDDFRYGKYEVLVYNEEFITQNVQSYGNIPGVFTITKEDADDKEKLDQAILERAKIKREYDRASVGLIDVRGRIDAENGAVIKEIWKSTEEIRRAFPETQTGFKSDSRKFFQKIIDTPAKDCDLEKIGELYEMAYKGGAKEYKYYPTIQSAELPDSQLLQKQIVSSGSTLFAEFVRTLNNLSWVEHGHQNYRGERCPYCQQRLPDTFEEDLASCYDATYQSDMKGLQNFYREYGECFSDIYGVFSGGLGNDFDCPLISQYQDKLKILESSGRHNLELIQYKIQNPHEVVRLEDVDSILGELTSIMYKINALIKENNNRARDIKAVRNECIEMIWGKMAFDCQTIIAGYKGKMQFLIDQESMGKKAVIKRDKEIQTLDLTINDLNTKTTNTAFVMNNINKMLDMGGFQGFHLREKPNARYVYQLVREDGRVADGLSEGERHIISFLYFYHLVIGSQDDNGERKDKIVIIDDPVSSMDSTSMALVAQLVRNMVSVCYNNYDLDRPDGAEEYIKQFFCLTHNPYFFKEITYNRIADYNCVSFYELKKEAGNHSKVILCTREKKAVGAGMENYSPVRNYYDGLWHEFKETEDPIALSIAMRGILEYYFLQMCGYPSAELRTALLNVEQTGRFDKNDYDLAYSLLSALDQNRGHLDDGINLDSSSFDLNQSRKVFKLIFDLMHQEQHYKLMMGIK